MPNSQTVASLKDLRNYLEESFANDFRPDFDQIDYIYGKQRQHLTINLYQEWRLARVKDNIGCKYLRLLNCCSQIQAP